MCLAGNAYLIATDHLQIPTLMELKFAIFALPNNKDAGDDDLPAEFLKLSLLFHALINASWMSEKFQDEWNEGFIVKISKKEIYETVTIYMEYVCY